VCAGTRSRQAWHRTRLAPRLQTCALERGSWGTERWVL